VSAWNDPAVKFVAVLGALAVVAASGSAAARRPPVSLPFSVAFFDARHGVIGTDRTIETTADGGRTWTIQHSGAGPYRLVEEWHGDEVWAVGPRGQYLHSRDRGATWRRAARPPVSGVAFGTPLLGWTVKQRDIGSPAWLSETRDGGRSWRRIGRVCRDLGGFAGLAHVAPARGWIVCRSQPTGGMQPKSVHETQDGGRTWTLRACACFQRSRGRIDMAGYPFAVEFTARGDGALLHTRGYPITLTHDGGRTWRFRVGRPEVDFRLDTSIVSARLVFAIAGSMAVDARLIMTRDGGRTWRTVRRWD
jgi:photosystem II stability/assembly factor-like uncharacterized protein